MRIIDISLTIEPGMLVYPKNPEVEIESIDTGHSTISKILFGSHTGTHVDAPAHVINDGKGVGDIDPSRFVGPCRVLDLVDVDESISVEDLEKCNIKNKERILVKTSNSARGFDRFYDDYVYLGGDAADYLAEKNILLFGIDYLSVKKKGGKDNRPHTSLLEKEIPIFEGLNLSNVDPGNYVFLGLPLKIEGLDGAPARVLLIE